MGQPLAECSPSTPVSLSTVLGFTVPFPCYTLFQWIDFLPQPCVSLLSYTHKWAGPHGGNG